MSSKNVTFKLDNNSHHSKTLSLLDEGTKRRRSSKLTVSSMEDSTKFSFSKRKSRPSIFSGEVKLSNNYSSTRIDAFGNEINKKGSKDYKVSFIDQISNEKIAEVILIESSYKNNDLNNSFDNECKCSSCFIF